MRGPRHDRPWPRGILKKQDNARALLAEVFDIDVDSRLVLAISTMC